MITKQEILEKYPEMFKLKDTDPKTSCMFWGLGVPTAWLPVIDELCTCLHGGWDYFGGYKRPQVVADQVKEKFNQLRFYYHLEFGEENVPQEIHDQYRKYYDGMITYAEMRIRNLEKRVDKDE